MTTALSSFSVQKSEHVCILLCISSNNVTGKGKGFQRCSTFVILKRMMGKHQSKPNIPSKSSDLGFVIIAYSCGQESEEYF